MTTRRSILNLIQSMPVVSRMILVSTVSLAGAAPKTSLVGVSVDDTAFGNGDGELEPGETANLKLKLHNSGTSAATSVSGELTVSNPEAIILDNMATWVDLVPNGSPAFTDAPHFQVALPSQMACGTTLAFGLRVLTAQGADAFVFYLKVGQRTDHDLQHDTISRFTEQEATFWAADAGDMADSGAAAAIHRARVFRLLELERVRTRIATDLHDDLGASLSRISILSELARRQASPGAGATDNLLAEVGSSARGLIEAASDIVWSIDPRQDDLGSLVARLRQLAADLFDGTGVAWRFDAPERAEDLALATERRRHLYLILKEAMNNIVRHGHASHVIVSIRIEDRRIVAEVADDGAGFDLAADAQPRLAGGGRGLVSMRSRARQAGGVLSVVSSPGQGSTIGVTIPLA